MFFVNKMIEIDIILIIALYSSERLILIEMIMKKTLAEINRNLVH